MDRGVTAADLAQGADTELLHLVRPADEARLSAGAEVRAVWREERKGELMDIECFELAE